MPLKHKLLNNFGTNRDILMKFLWLITTFMVWNDDEMMGVASHAHLTKASADFKHYAKKLGRYQKFSKKFLASKN